MQNLKLASSLFDTIRPGAKGAPQTPTGIGNNIFRDLLQRQGRQLVEKGSSDSFEELRQFGVPTQELVLPAEARPLVISFLSNQGLNREEIEPLLRSATGRGGGIHLGRLMAKVRHAMRQVDPHHHVVRSPDTPQVEQLLFKMGLGAGEVKEIREKAVSQDGRLLMKDLSSALNEHLSEHVSEERLTTLFGRFGIEMEQKVNELEGFDRNLREVLKALRETDSRAGRDSLKARIAGLLREKGIPPQEVKSFLDTLSVSQLRGLENKPSAGDGANLINGAALDDRQQWQQGTWRDAIAWLLESRGQALREKGVPSQGVKSFLDTLSVSQLRGLENKPSAGDGASLVNRVVLDDRQQWQQGTWRDAIVRLLESGGQSLREGRHQGSSFADVSRWVATGQGIQKGANLETVLSLESGLTELMSERQVQRRLPLGSRTERSQTHAGKVEAGVLSAHPERTKAALETAPVQQPRPSTALPQPLPKILDRMVWMIRGGEQRSRIHISPPELGRLDIELFVKQGGHVQASLGTETLAAKELIEASLSQLRQQLADHGLSVERFEVMVGLADQGSTEREARSGAWGGERPKRRNASASAVREEEELPHLPEQGHHQIDLHV